MTVQPGFFLKRNLSQRLPRSVAIGLFALRSVNAIHANLDLPIRMRCILRGASGSQGIAVADADDKAEKGGCDHVNSGRSVYPSPGAEAGA